MLHRASNAIILTVKFLVINLILIFLYKQMCDVLHTASKKCIPSSKIDCYKEHIVPGFNEHVKELHDIARHDFVMWRSAGKP